MFVWSVYFNKNTVSSVTLSPQGRMTNELTCLGSVLQNRWSLIRHCLESACFSLNKIRVCMVFKEICRRYFSQTESTYVTKQRVFFLRVRVQNKCHSSSAMLVIDIRTKKKKIFRWQIKASENLSYFDTADNKFKLWFTILFDNLYSDLKKN